MRLIAQGLLGIVLLASLSCSREDSEAPVRGKASSAKAQATAPAVAVQALPDRYAELRAIREHIASANGAFFNRDGTLLATSATMDGRVCIWEVSTWKRRYSIDVGSPVNSIDWRDDGRTVGACVQTQEIVLVDAAEGRVADAISTGEKGCLFLAFRPGRAEVAAAQSYGLPRRPAAAIDFWNLSTLQKVRSAAGHAPSTECLRFSPDGRTLASGGLRHDVRLWDADSGRELGVLEDHSKAVTAMAFSPDGTTLATLGGKGDDLRVWDWKARKLLQKITTGGGLAVAIRGDGRMLAYGTFEGKIGLWDLASRSELQVIEAHKGAVQALSFTPDGRLLASASSDSTIKVWQLKAQ